MRHYTKDYDLSADDLEEKCSPDGEGQHPGYTLHAWREHVKCRFTLAGYWDWVRFELQCEMEDLDKDNPYTRGISEFT